MELILNLVWLTTAVIAFAGAVIWTRRERTHRPVAAAIILTACIMAVLFPVISMSDDMQAAVAVVETSFSARRIILSAVSQLATVLTFTPLLGASFRSLLIAVGKSSAEPFRLPSSPAAPVFSLRGPPSSVC
jgi:uncharacterized iron-regulated membrane protein